MAGASKQKGAAFERLICRKLSMWISRGTNSDLFWRSAMSGGRATVAWTKKDKTVKSSGDITATDAAGYLFTAAFSVECKSYKDYTLDALIFNRKGGLPEFWRQCRRDANRSMKQPLLIVKKNNYQEIVCVSATGMKMLGIDMSMIKAIFPAVDMHILLLSDLIEQIEPILVEEPRNDSYIRSTSDSED